MRTKTKEERIDYVIENFDFGIVSKTKEFFEWEVDEFGKHHIGKDVISAQNLLSKAYDYTLREKKVCYLSTGRFKATADWSDERLDIVTLSLQFVVAGWEYSDYND